jgi:regulator of cell morphogenesis and NO signaling
MNISSALPVGRLATELPLATRVFARHGIDFCCGGGAPLEQACNRRGLDVERILDEIRAEVETPDETPVRWDQKPLPALIDHILTAYHGPLKEELPRLETMARKVHQVHGDKDPQRLVELVRVVAGLRRELEEHMGKEEQVLFPMILEGHGALSGPPVRMMEQEHESAAAALRRLRELTDDYQVPAAACTTWRALWHGLEALEGSLHRHIHLENNILFPRAQTVQVQHTA